MSIPSKDKARARLPKRVPGKGQKFTLTMVQYYVCLELRGEIAIESATSVFIFFFVTGRSCCARLVVLSRHEKLTHRVRSPAQARVHARNTSYNETQATTSYESSNVTNGGFLTFECRLSPTSHPSHFHFFCLKSD